MAIVLAIQLLGLIIFAPIKLGVLCQFSLNREVSFVQIRVFGANAIRVKFEVVKNKICVSINGKNLNDKNKSNNRQVGKKSAINLKKHRNKSDKDAKSLLNTKNDKQTAKNVCKKKQMAKSAPALFKFLKNEKLVTLTHAVGLVGGEDAADCALKLGALNIVLLMFGANNKK
ncbi:MAG: hypothetical protein RR338_04550, partial [Clostridia bacterium]